MSSPYVPALHFETCLQPAHFWSTTHVSGKEASSMHNLKKNCHKLKPICNFTTIHIYEIADRTPHKHTFKATIVSVPATLKQIIQE
jgi:hypothetical protein